MQPIWVSGDQCCARCCRKIVFKLAHLRSPLPLTGPKHTLSAARNCCLYELQEKSFPPFDFPSPEVKLLRKLVYSFFSLWTVQPTPRSQTSWTKQISQTNRKENYSPLFNSYHDMNKFHIHYIINDVSGGYQFKTYKHWNIYKIENRKCQEVSESELWHLYVCPFSLVLTMTDVSGRIWGTPPSTTSAPHIDNRCQTTAESQSQCNTSSSGRKGLGTARPCKSTPRFQRRVDFSPVIEIPQVGFVVGVVERLNDLTANKQLDWLRERGARGNATVLHSGGKRLVSHRAGHRCVRLVVATLQLVLCCSC